jgi:hypothetical protein
LLTGGGFTPQEEFIPFGSVNTTRLNELFSRAVVSRLVRRGLIAEVAGEQLLSQEHTGFSSWVGEPFSDEESKKFVCRYVERGPLSLESLSLGDDHQVVVSTKEGKEARYEPLEFLVLLTSHIPNTYESITRYYGWYSSRRRGERRKREQVSAAGMVATEEPDDTPASFCSSWAQCLKAVYEIDPLECPKCQGQMKIIAYLQDPKVITKIMKAQGLPSFRAPPPLPKYLDIEEDFEIFSC